MSLAAMTCDLDGHKVTVIWHVNDECGVIDADCNFRVVKSKMLKPIKSENPVRSITPYDEKNKRERVDKMRKLRLDKMERMIYNLSKKRKKKDAERQP